MKLISYTRGAPAPRSLRRTSSAIVIFLTVASAYGCRDADVIAEVGHTELRRSDLVEFSSRRATGAEALDAELEALVGQARLAEQAVSAGLDQRADVRARLSAARREVLAQVFLQEELQGATSEANLRERFESTKASLARRQVHVRQVIIRIASNADAAERRRAMDRASLIYARIIGGEAFEDVAREVSQDEVSAVRGGDLGIVREGQVHASFFEAAAALKKDEVSKPFETPYGIHVVQALAPVETVMPTFEEARGRVAAEARREAESHLMKELETKIPVKRFPAALSALDGGTHASGASAGEGGQQ
ncbi:peptidylprolyl isomerase [Myxococcus virescens]|nr:peptidylprolyl isomerase [Myxococcus virescens]